MGAKRLFGFVLRDDEVEAAHAPPEAAPPDDRFIPVRAIDLVRAIEEDPDAFAGAGEWAADIEEAIRDIAEQEATSLERSVAELYAEFNPDRDTVQLDCPIPPDVRMHDLATLASYLLIKANFVKLSDVQIEEALSTANSHGLRVRVDHDMVERLDLWVRGRATTTRRRRTIRRPWRGVPMTLDVFQRLVVVGRLAGEHHVFLKLFREIPVADIEALLPHAEVAPTWWDRIKVWGGGAGAFGGVGMKLLQGIALTGAAFATFLWLVISACVLMAVRTILGYKRTRTARDWQRTRHLYFQNMANNAGVVHTLVALLSGEEVKEALLAYVFCRMRTDADDGQAPGADDLRTQVESWINRRFGREMIFDVDDAIETLERLDLFADRGRLEVVDPDEALRRLHEHRKGRKSWRYHHEQAEAMAGA